MYRIRKQFRFEASHQLHGHDGKCARLHGHSWTMTVELASNDLIEVGPKAGMVADYGDVSALVEPLVEQFLDHHHLNDTLATARPTSEFIARWAFEMLNERLPRLSAVTISETCTSECRYEER